MKWEDGKDCHQRRISPFQDHGVLLHMKRSVGETLFSWQRAEQSKAAEDYFVFNVIEIPEEQDSTPVLTLLPIPFFL